MAEDLAPRPPAGTAPAPVEPAESATAEKAPAATARKRTASQSRPFRYRFGIAYLVLAVVAGIGVGSAYLLWEREPEEQVAWSDWEPVGRDGTYAAQIAEQIGGKYRNIDGGELVGVIASAPQVQTREGGVPIQWVAIQEENATSTQDNGENFDIVPVGENALMYTLCGFGDRCSIREGTPSQERARVLRRESLELALYTFKYVDGASSVIVLMPPNLGDPETAEDDTQTALFFQKSDFEHELERPVKETLAGQTPRRLRINTIEQLTIDRLTQPRTFLAEFQPTQAGGWVIVLAPVFNLP